MYNNERKKQVLASNIKFQIKRFRQAQLARSATLGDTS